MMKKKMEEEKLYSKGWFNIEKLLRIEMAGKILFARQIKGKEFGLNLGRRYIQSALDVTYIFSVNRQFNFQNNSRDPTSYTGIMWYSFLNGCGFLGHHTHPGQVHILCQEDIDSSRQESHPGLKTSSIFLIQSSIICLTSQSVLMQLWCTVSQWKFMVWGGDVVLV
jgi:hypothetical protein